MNIELKIIPYEEYCTLRFMQKEHVDFKRVKGCVYIGAYADGVLAGATGFCMVGKNVRFKGSCVRPEYRGQGIFRMLWEEREQLTRGMSKVTNGFATTMSAHMYEKTGFKAVREMKNGIKFYVRENKL